MKTFNALLLCSALACQAHQASAASELHASQLGNISAENINLGESFLTFNWVSEAQNIGLLQFDLSGQTSVASAQLQLYQLFNNGDGAVFELYANTSAWSSQISDWEARPAHLDEAAARLEILDPASARWRVLDVTSTVNAWISGALPNYGFTLQRIDQLNPYVYFSASADMGGAAPLLSLSPVPEPSAALLLALGVAALALRQRRKFSAGSRS